jgi:hypothetical protein
VATYAMNFYLLDRSLRGVTPVIRRIQWQWWQQAANGQPPNYGWAPLVTNAAGLTQQGNSPIPTVTNMYPTFEIGDQVWFAVIALNPSLTNLTFTVTFNADADSPGTSSNPFVNQTTTLVINSNATQISAVGGFNAWITPTQTVSVAGLFDFTLAGSMTAPGGGETSFSVDPDMEVETGT